MKIPLGIRYILLSGLSFFIVNFFVKILGGNSGAFENLGFQSYGAHELVFFRSLVSFSISAYVIKKRGIPFFGINKKWLLIRGISGVIALTIFFFTLQKLPLAVAAVVQYLSPIFTVLLAILVLKEKIMKTQWLFITTAFAGVLLIGVNNFIFGKELALDTTWLLLGVISAFFSGVAYVAIVKLKPTDSPISIVMYFPMLALPIMGVWCLFDFVFPQGWEWLILLLIGVFTQMAQILMTKALHVSDTSRIVPFQYLGAIYAILVGWLAFDERLNSILIIGIALIFVSVIANALLRYKVKA
jgi:drug/metabolite transporter (DMT)-like permease